MAFCSAAFAAQPHVDDGASMLIAEDAVVHADERGAAEERVDRVGNAIEQGEVNGCRVRVVGVLDHSLKTEKPLR